MFLVVSAPSGAGKTTLCRRLLSEFPGFRYSVSCTTRPPRAGETHGRDYFFLNEQEFRKRVERREFLEYAEVHGHWYGTLRQQAEDVLRGGLDVLLDIDVQGAAQIRTLLRTYPASDLLRRAYVDVFITAPSLAELRRRLESRGQDAPAVIDRRMRQAQTETERSGEYMFTLVNDDLERAYKEFRAVVAAARQRPDSWL